MTPPMQVSGTLATDLMKGAVAGAASVWVMDRLDWLMVEYGDQDAWRRTNAVRPNHMDPAHNIASMVSKAVGHGPIRQPHPAGIATHYAIGIVPAAIYGATRQHLPGGLISRGLVFGLGMFLIEDELVNTLTGAAAKPQDYPWQAHARGLVSHLVLGLAIEAVLGVLDLRRRREEQPLA